MKKKLLAILLSVFMIMGTFTTNVFAYNGINSIGILLKTRCEQTPTSSDLSAINDPENIESISITYKKDGNPVSNALEVGDYIVDVVVVADGYYFDSPTIQVNGYTEGISNVTGDGTDTLSFTYSFHVDLNAAHILATVEGGFPKITSWPPTTVPDNSWKNDAGHKLFLDYNNNLAIDEYYNYFFGIFETNVTQSGNDYVYTDFMSRTFTFIMEEGNLTSINVAGFTNDNEELNGTYSAPVTIANILDTVPGGFPTTIESGWVSQDGSKTYINEDNLQSGDVLPLNSILTPSGNDYEIIKGDNTFTFVMESGVLSRITMLPALASLVSYYPYAYTNSPVSVQAGNNDIEFVTNGKYVDQSTTPVTVSVDDTPLTYDADYEVTPGSTHVKLKGSYISTLAVGSHTIKISMTGYSDLTSPFTITGSTPTPTPEPEDDTPRYHIPNTGVEGVPTNNHSLLKLSSLSLLAIGTYLVIKKKKDND